MNAYEFQNNYALKDITCQIAQQNGVSPFKHCEFFLQLIKLQRTNNRKINYYTNNLEPIASIVTYNAVQIIYFFSGLYFKYFKFCINPD